ncbi:MAG: Holliday junction resolvase RuvX [Betaproteobacteria bacterium]|nr:Holliday junction resolvase RuvX [Betaproteobacteria bacterium]
MTGGSGTVLAFDFGEKRVGVATGAANIRIAHPLETIHAESNDDRFTRIATLLAEWQPTQLVVGLPTHIDGTEHELTRLARKFANRLNGRFNLPVALVDERLTSAEAEERLREVGITGRGQKAHVDAVAAQSILQSWFDQHHDQTT